EISVGATCIAFSIARFSFGSLPIISNRCFIVCMFSILRSIFLQKRSFYTLFLYKVFQIKIFHQYPLVLPSRTIIFFSFNALKCACDAEWFICYFSVGYVRLVSVIDFLVFFV